METIELYEIAKEWFFSQIKGKEIHEVWPNNTVMLMHFGKHLLEQSNVSGSLPNDELNSAAEKYLIPRYFIINPTVEEEIKEFNELKDAFKAGYMLRQ